MKKNSKKAKKIRGLVIGWGCFVIVILLLIWIFSNKSLYTPNKAGLEGIVRSTISRIETLGVPVYKKIIDKGCPETDIAVFSSHYECAFEAKVYFKGNGDAAQNLQKLNETLEEMGFHRKAGTDLSGKEMANISYEAYKGSTVYAQILDPIHGRQQHKSI